MLQDNFELTFLPMFYDDLGEITDYISYELKNPDAADRLIDDIFVAIDERLPVADSFKPYKSAYEFRYKYYNINIRNFIVFYVVIDDVPEKKIMEVRRVLYNKRNIKDII